MKVIFRLFSFETDFDTHVDILFKPCTKKIVFLKKYLTVFTTPFNKNHFVL